MFNKVFLGFGAAALLFYSVAEWRGWEFASPKPESAEVARARHTSGGTRGWSWWFGGFRGGK